MEGGGGGDETWSVVYRGFFFFLKGVALLLRNVLAAAPFLPRSFLFALA